MDDTKSNPQKLIKPELPGGFRDALPEDMIAKQRMIDTIRRVFESFGFDPMETPAVEQTEVLVGGEAESGKIIFNVKGSEEKTLGKARDKQSDTSLRFDLTVPLARVLAANPEIPKPFKRYQIGKAWRGERQQAGRYREFLQMDVDIIGTKSLDADVEIVQVIYETLRALGVENFKIKLNNKAEIVETLRQAGIRRANEMKSLIAIDKKDKRAPEAWAKEVGRVSGLKGERLQKLLWGLSGENMLETTMVRALREKTEKLGVPQKYLMYDASLVRGLGYYTGSIFETVLVDLPSIGSVFSGGRFDGLTARFSREAMPAVGASIGVDRLFAALDQLGKIEKQQTLTEVMIFNLSDAFSADYSQFANDLRAAGINTTLYLGDDRAFGAQLAYAVKKEIPFVLIYGEKEAADNQVQIKDLRQNEQTAIPKSEVAAFIKNRPST